MPDVKAILSRNLGEVRQRIADAARRAGRRPEDVTLVAVTKYVDVETIRALHELGVEDFGESRPQELWRKAAAVPEVRWHLVGHLQRNKVERTLPLVHMIHSVDSDRLLWELETEKKWHRPVDVLLEFNLTGEPTKHGFAPGDVGMLAVHLDVLLSVRVIGLMTMAPLVPNPEEARVVFAGLRKLRQELDSRSKSRIEHHDLRHLSMGMTIDFEVAIEEGATLVRIGSALFRGLEGFE